MNNAFRVDFEGFVDSRLDFIDKGLFANPEHMALQAKLNALESTMKKKFDADIDSLDEGFMELLTLCQRTAYQQGFKDGITFMAGS